MQLLSPHSLSHSLCPSQYGYMYRVYICVCVCILCIYTYAMCVLVCGEHWRRLDCWEFNSQGNGKWLHLLISANVQGSMCSWKAFFLPEWGMVNKYNWLSLKEQALFFLGTYLLCTGLIKEADTKTFGIGKITNSQQNAEFWCSDASLGMKYYIRTLFQCINNTGKKNNKNKRSSQ